MPGGASLGFHRGFCCEQLSTFRKYQTNNEIPRKLRSTWLKKIAVFAVLKAYVLFFQQHSCVPGDSKRQQNSSGDGCDCKSRMVRMSKFELSFSTIGYVNNWNN